MKKKLLSVLLALISSLAFCIPSYASNDNESSFTVRCIDHEEFESALSEHDVCLITPTASPRVSPCCDAMRVVWIKTEEWHLVEQGCSICLSVCYLGYRGCSNCSAVWDSTVYVYRQVGGCGQYHYADTIVQT